MKKTMTLIMVFIFTFVLSSCVDPIEEVDLKIVVPHGSAYLSQLHMDYTHPNIGDNVEYDIIKSDDSGVIEDAFTDAFYDIIYAPINVGAIAYQDEAPYTLAATIVMGQFSLLTERSEEFSMEDLEGAEIFAYEPNTAPGIVLEILIEEMDFDTPPTITYLDSMFDCIAEWEQDTNTFVLVEEWVRYEASLEKENIQSLNLISEWETFTGTEAIPYYGIFVKDGTNADAVEAYLREVQISVLEWYKHTNDLMDMLDALLTTGEIEYPYDGTSLLNGLSANTLVYIDGLDSKSSIVSFFGYIKDYDETLMGEQYPVNDFYYE